VALLGKATKYLGAVANHKLDQGADPRIQIEQAVTEAQRRHSELAEHAAQVIGAHHQIQLQLARAQSDAQRLQSDARQALVLADQARAHGNAVKAAGYEQTATVLASQLVTAESTLEALKSQYGQSEAAAAQAKDVVDSDSQHLQQILAQRARLLTQLQSAQMQETVTKNLQLADSLSAPGDTPTLEGISDRIEARYATALGGAELASDSAAGRMREVETASQDMAGQQRLAQLRTQLALPQHPDRS